MVEIDQDQLEFAAGRGATGAILARDWTYSRTGHDALLWRGGTAILMVFLLVGSFWFWHQ